MVTAPSWCLGLPFSCAHLNLQKLFIEFLPGKVAVITGGGRGIGQAIAEKYATQGFTLILTARSKDQLEETAASCKAKGSPAVDIHGIDLSQSSQVGKFADDVLHKYKKVDVLINNAGMGTKSGSGPIEGDSSEWEMAVNLNLIAPMLLTQAFAAGMVENKAGLIINIGSIAAESGMAGQSVYAATKWGLRGWSLSCYEGVFNQDLSLEAEDIAEAAMLPLITTALCVPKEMTLDTTQKP
ncbi:TPA: hypothetical protein ACH3X1_001318 [Trebouxia sp. C0004]